jgi:hypothetical protein
VEARRCQLWSEPSTSLHSRQKSLIECRAEIETSAAAGIGDRFGNRGAAYCCVGADFWSFS